MANHYSDLAMLLGGMNNPAAHIGAGIGAAAPSSILAQLLAQRGMMPGIAAPGTAPVGAMPIQSGMIGGRAPIGMPGVLPPRMA